MKYPLILTALFLVCISCVYGHADTSSFTRFRLYSEQAVKLLAGGHIPMTEDENKKTHSRKYLELGLHLTVTNDPGIHPPGAFTWGPSLEFPPGTTPIYGLKMSSWLCASLFVIGFSTVYYTDFDRGNFKIRPEFGFGFHTAKLTFGLNIPTIGNADFPPLKSSLTQISFNMLLKVRTIKKTEYAIPAHNDPGNTSY